MLARYVRLRRWAQLLGIQLIAQLQTGQWEPPKSSSLAAKNPKFKAISEALRLELPSRGTLAAISMLDQVLDLLAGPLIRMIHCLKALGWAACLTALLGALFHLGSSFRAMTQSGSGGMSAVYSAYAEAIVLPIFGLAVGLACLILSSFSRIRLHSIHQGISDKILAEFSKKAK